MTLLTIGNANTQFNSYTERYKPSKSNVITGIAIATGIITGVFIAVAGYTKLSNISPVVVSNKNNEALYNFMTFMFWILATPVGLAAGGVFSGFGLSCFGEVLLDARIESLRNRRAKITSKYHSETGINPSEIPAFLKLLDRQSRIEMAAHMNFEQLYWAKGFMGDKEFKAAIQVEGEDHRLWRQILEMPKTHSTPLQVESFLNGYAAKQKLKQHPSILNALIGVYKDPKIQKVLRKRLFSLLKTETQETATVSVKLATKTLELNRDLLAANSDVIRCILQEEEQVDLSKFVDADLMEPLLRLISGEDVDVDEKLIVFAAVLQVVAVSVPIQNYLISELTEEELMRFYLRDPGSTVIRKHLVEVKLKIELTPENIMQFIEDTKELNSIRIAQMISEYRRPDLTCGNFEDLYKISVCIKSVDPEFHESCLDFCRHNIEKLKSRMTWRLDEIPLEVAQILYQTVEQQQDISL